MLPRIARYLPFALAIALLMTTVAYAHGGDLSQIHACVNKAGAIRITGANSTCQKNETALDWNIQGLPGEPGPAGPEGPAGPPGPSGTGITIFPIHGRISRASVGDPFLCFSLAAIGESLCNPFLGALGDMNYRQRVMPMPTNGKLVSLAMHIFDNQLTLSANIRVSVNTTLTPLQIYLPPGEDNVVKTYGAEVPVQTGDLVVIVAQYAPISGYADFTGALAFEAE